MSAVNSSGCTIDKGPDDEAVSRAHGFFNKNFRRNEGKYVLSNPHMHAVVVPDGAANEIERADSHAWRTGPPNSLETGN